MKKFTAIMIIAALSLTMFACTNRASSSQSSAAGSSAVSSSENNETTAKDETTADETTVNKETDAEETTEKEQTEASTEATETTTEAPTETQAPTVAPTEAPTEAPTAAPTVAPTEAPTVAPTEAPTEHVHTWVEETTTNHHEAETHTELTWTIKDYGGGDCNLKGKYMASGNVSNEIRNKYKDIYDAFIPLAASGTWYVFSGDIPDDIFRASICGSGERDYTKWEMYDDFVGFYSAMTDGNRDSGIVYAVDHYSSSPVREFIFSTVTVVDKEAYDEVVSTGRTICSTCGVVQ